MSAFELRIELPESLTEEEAKILLSVKSFEVGGKLTLGQAARLADIQTSLPRDPGPL